MASHAEAHTDTRTHTQSLPLTEEWSTCDENDEMTTSLTNLIQLTLSIDATAYLIWSNASLSVQFIVLRAVQRHTFTAGTFLVKSPQNSYASVKMFNRT